MEDSVIENKAQQSFRSPPRRRRSTFFERRESLAPPKIRDDDNLNVCQNTDVNEKHNEELQRYYDKLLFEKEQWKKELKSRRNKYHELKEQYQMALKAPKETQISYAALSNEDINFIQGKLNLSKLVDSQQKLHKSVKETQALYRRLNEIEDHLLNYCEQKVNKVTKYILENSAIEDIDQCEK